MSVILLTFILALLVGYIIHKWKQASKWDHFPGLTKYTSLPMIGHAYMLSKNPSRELRDLTKKYGTIYRFDIGSVPTIILTEYEDIVAAYKQDVFSGRIFHSLDGFQNLKALDTHGESPGLATAVSYSIDSCTTINQRNYIDMFLKSHSSMDQHGETIANLFSANLTTLA